MKLLYCIDCEDMIRLIPNEIRSCRCGKTKGKYESDGRYAVVNGNGISIAISNHSLLNLLLYLEENQTELDRVFNIECWARPHEHPTLNKHTFVNSDLK